MLKIIYRTLWLIAPALIRHYLKKRAKKAPLYLEHWNERFGKPIANPVKGAIWIHAVSVGETRAAQPLIAALQKQYPKHPLLITQMTPTGRETAQNLYPKAQCRYLPYDHPRYVKQFFQEHQPAFGIIMETEIWPNLYQQAKQNNVPLFLANTRLSEKSLRGYLKAKNLITPALNCLSASFTQSEDDKNRLAQLTKAPQYITGNTKYDIEPPQEMLQLGLKFKQLAGNRKIVVCGSTRMDKEGVDEAEMLLKAWQKITDSNTLLVIVPRHPERFDSTKELAEKLGYQVQCRSDNQPIQASTHVWIGDSMGELFAYYEMADIVFVGGSLVDTGCQNIIEPMSCEKPTVFGPSTYNFAQVTQQALQQQAAIQINTAQEWQETITALLDNATAQQKLANAAKQLVLQHQGASQKITQIIKQSI